MKVIILSIALVFAHTAWSGDFEDGVAAFLNKEYLLALAKFQSEAKQGNARAYYFIGEIYYLGAGVAQDYKEAVHWYQLAARQGVIEAQLSLGFMYSNGQGLAQDYKEAVRWYKLAAQQGDPDAHYNLGFMYSNRRGGAQDYVRAHMWFNVSAANGKKASSEYRDMVARKMTPQQIEQAQRMARECMASNFKKCD